MKQRGLLVDELEVLETLRDVATIAIVVGGVRYAHVAYNEGDGGKLIISAFHFLIAGFMYSITFDSMAHFTDVDLAGNFSGYVNYNEYDL